MSELLGIGIGAPGLGRPLPSPGASARCLVELTRSWGDGAVTSETQENVWDGYTASDARQERVKRLKDARRPYRLDGEVLELTTDVGEWTETERITWVDQHREVEGR